MPSFMYGSLLWWGLPLVGLPVLIHLINLMRHRRVQWAAMEFLLQSQKRHRKSILFKQLLLLLLRMAAMAAVVLAAAQPLLRNQWSALFGGSRTHHIVLLDDSFSMADRWADTSAFEQAKAVITRLAATAERQDSPQVFTLLRFSKAGQVARGTQPDLLEARVDGQFAVTLEKVLGPLTPSETAAGPQEALDAVERLPPKADEEDRLVYLVTDFRANQWQEPEALADTLQAVSHGGAQLHLINCVNDVHQNLAIAALQPAAGTRAAGVPLMVEVSVRNFGPNDARGVSVALEEDGQARPPVVFDEVPAGQTVTRKFPVLFDTAGQHQLSARLEMDAVDADNRRSLVIEVPKTVEILLIDSDARGSDAYFLASALAPGGKVTSGLHPQIESPRYLRNHALDGFDTIYLLNVDRLDAAEVAALEAFVRGGGGLGIFVGERTRADAINSALYRGGEGLMPVPLGGPQELLVDRLETAPDVEVTDHPVFAVFAGERNSFLNTVTIARYFATEKDWQPEPDSETRVIARLRNKAPLVVEKRFGEGRVITVLTKASPLATELGSWNNWARGNPSFVVTMLELQSYLAAGRHPDTSRLVATPLQIPIDVSLFARQVRFVLPVEQGGASLLVDAVAPRPAGEGNTEQQDDGAPSDAEEQADEASANAAGGEASSPVVAGSDSPNAMPGAQADMPVATLTETDTSGVYEARLTRLDGTEEVERFALNIAPDEGNLKRLDSAALASRLIGLRYEYHDSQDINYNPQQLAGVNLGQSLLYVLLVVLLCEQVLAYACSYHPRAKEARAG